MIVDGFADEYTYDQPYAYLDAFRAAQETAIANRVGLWSPATCAGDTEQPAAPEQPASPVAINPPVAPTPVPVPPTGFDPTKYIGQGDRYNCSAFASQALAQPVLRADPRDPNRLDADSDGIACESNRAARDEVPVPRSLHFARPSGWIHRRRVVESGIGHLHRAALQRSDQVHHGKESPNRDGSKGRRGPVAELRTMSRE